MFDWRVTRPIAEVFKVLCDLERAFWDACRLEVLCEQKAIVLNYICYMFAKQVNASFFRIDPIIIVGFPVIDILTKVVWIYNVLTC